MFSDIFCVKKTDIALCSDVDYIIRQSITAMLGDERLYTTHPEEVVYDEIYLHPETSNPSDSPPVIVLKALRKLMIENNADYDWLVNKAVKTFESALETYDFVGTGEKIEQDQETGLLKLMYGNYYDIKLDRLIKSGVSGVKRWRLLAGNYENQRDAMIPYNFFSEVFRALFNVPVSARSHILRVIPNIHYPSLTLEAFVYLKFLRMPETHYDKTCLQAVEKYNRNIHVDPENDFIMQTYPITIRNEDEIIPDMVDEILDRKAKLHEPYEPMLLLFLCFSASCKNDEIVWDTIPYYELYSLMKTILTYKRNDNTSIIGRIISDSFYKDMRKAVFIKIQSSVKRQETVEISSSVFTGIDIIKPSKEELFAAANEEIINYMSSGLPSEMWSDSSELPASWIALL